MSRQRLIGFLRRGDPTFTAFIVITVLGLFLFQRLAYHSLGAAVRNPLLIGLGLPLLCALAWVISAKVAADAAAVHAANVEAERLAHAADVRFTERPVFECSEDEFAALADGELDTLPSWVKSAVAANNVAIAVEDERAGEPRVLGVFQRAAGTSEVVLYRLPILRAAVNRQHLRRVVHDTMLHELGHLFGMTEEDLDRYTIGNNPLPGVQPVHPPRSSP
jgi:predicted Zn-dependent protease with MMP-like domain